MSKDFQLPEGLYLDHFLSSWVIEAAVPLIEDSHFDLLDAVDFKNLTLMAQTEVAKVAPLFLPSPWLHVYICRMPCACKLKALSGYSETFTANCGSSWSYSTCSFFALYSLHSSSDKRPRYGMPHHRYGDIHLVSYVFIGDFVDRGIHSLEVRRYYFWSFLINCSIRSLPCSWPLKYGIPIEYFYSEVRKKDATFNLGFAKVTSGNHEDREVNAMYGFKSECVTRFGILDGSDIWERCNAVFDWMPLSAIIEDKIFCVHGGIGAVCLKFFQWLLTLNPLLTYFLRC